MIDVLINIDVGDLDSAVEFYTRAFELRVGRRLGRSVVELLGGSSRIYLMRKKAGSAPFERATSGRSYARHWTPVHFDLVVPDVERALERARAAGATQEGAVARYDWGTHVVLADPFGHGVCLVSFSERGYDALTEVEGEAAKKRLLVVAHAPSENTQRMLRAVLEGAQHEEASGVSVRSLSPFETRVEDVMRADAIILFTPENLGYMSGALKDFFDRIYDRCLDGKRGLPCAVVIRGKHDGTGTRRGIESVLTGLGWKLVDEPLICRGDFDESFLEASKELGAKVAVGLDAGIF